MEIDLAIRKSKSLYRLLWIWLAKPLQVLERSVAENAAGV
jgi:hypothetical protein